MRAQIEKAREHTAELQRSTSEQHSSALAMRAARKKARVDCAELIVAKGHATHILRALRTVEEAVQAQVLDKSKAELAHARSVRDNLRSRLDAAAVAAHAYVLERFV